MPTISVKRDLLFQALGRSYSDDEFADLCFEFGIELDEVSVESSLDEWKENTSHVSVDVSGQEIVYKIEIPANR
jgi:phenylalanyl-tRNA synthetase beta chain